MRFNSVGFALSVGMALIVVLIGFTLLSAAGLAGFAAEDVARANEPEAPKTHQVSATRTSVPSPAASPEEAAAIAAGDALFKGNCAQCHAVNEQVVGPALAGISKRRPLSWLLPWVKNSSKVVASGDDYAVALFNKFNKQQMPSFSLSDKEIAAIVAYIKSEEGRSEPMPPADAIASAQ
ncbi:c-type cytochrome [Hymenobacter sp. M29]|uniref:C-type cytochrome n=1 Tax=Hymenobacter mellowenesis TaxID=3063995 RepID=A0ABT9ADZ7_9BACT|nr:cytochrome c [Hymenobacter sp. M29]MDO7848068.1 c-type cytochrome [Hymenobacter sp. M29]